MRKRITGVIHILWTWMCDENKCEGTKLTRRRKRVAWVCLRSSKIRREVSCEGDALRDVQGDKVRVPFFC